MHRFQRFASFFKIRPGEERLVGYLVLLAFVLELAFVFIQSMAFGVFLAEYGPQGLPYSYIVIAIFASLAAVLYIKVSERVSFSRALMLNLASLGALNFLVWLGLKSAFSHFVSFILPLLFQIILNLGNLVVWQLAGRLFNLQQGKRLFPLLSSGTWLANIAGGLLVLPLVNWMGAINLLLPSTLIIALAVLILHTITRNYPIQELSRRKPRRTIGESKQSSGLLQNRYILMIIAFLTIWWIAFFFLDNIFADLVTLQFPDANQLTAFRGQLLSMTGVVALIASTFLTSRIIGRFGLKAGLLSEALPVTIILGWLAISGSLGGTIMIAFALAALAKLLNVALGFSVSQAAYVMLYQPLPDSARGRAQATAEGVFQPIASGLAGISLLTLTTAWKFDYLGLSYVYLVLGTALLIVILLLNRSYLSALTQAITKRRLGEFPMILADPASLALLKSRLHDPHPGVAMYALTRLEELDSSSIAAVLPELIRHPAPEVRREAFSRVERLKLRTALDATHRQLTVETIPSVKESGLRALGAIAGPESCSLLLDALDQTNIPLLRGALIGLLKYQETERAEQALDHLLSSSSTAERILAAQVLGEANGARYGQAYQTLLRDPVPTVKREALQSAAKSRQPALYPLIIEACDSPETSRVAAQALIALGTEILPEVEAAFSQPAQRAPRQRLLTLPKIIGRIGGMRAHALLLSRIDSSDGELRSQILNALSECGYRANDQSQIYTAIKREVQGMAWVCATHTQLDDTEQAALLSNALRQIITQTRERVLLLLSFAFDTSAMLRVREVLFTGSTSQLSYVLEIIDTQLPAEWKPMILPLFENLSPQDQLQQIALIFPQARQTIEERLHTIIAGSEEHQFTEWVRACAMYAAVQLRAHTCYELIQDAVNHSEGLIHDTACWALTQLSPETQRESNDMLSTIEKVLILKTVGMFSHTPDDVLADVANLLEEMEVSANETIFQKDDQGDSMYIIVDGKVRVHTDERLLNYLGESDVFGEMALLDPEPRLASVTAVEPTRLFRLDQSPFYQLIAERPEVATGIIRVLTRLLRDRVRDLAQLQSRIKELER